MVQAWQIGEQQMTITPYIGHEMHFMRLIGDDGILDYYTCYVNNVIVAIGNSLKYEKSINRFSGFYYPTLEHDGYIWYYAYKNFYNEENAVRVYEKELNDLVPAMFNPTFHEDEEESIIVLSSITLRWNFMINLQQRMKEYENRKKVA